MGFCLEYKVVGFCIENVKLYIRYKNIYYLQLLVTFLEYKFNEDGKYGKYEVVHLFEF